MIIKVETEAKYYCDNHSKLINRIKELKFRELTPELESDEYFTDIDSLYIKNRTCLRIRKTDNTKMEVTFKGKSSALLGEYCKMENNISASIKDYNNFLSLFSSLGYYSYVTVEKHRRTFTKKDKEFTYNIMVDSLPGIGDFTEFEIISKQNVKKSDLLKTLDNLLSLFKDISLVEENRPYRDVVASSIFNKYNPKNGLDNIYINLDRAFNKYEKDFFKKYKDSIGVSDFKEYKALNNDKLLKPLYEDYLNNLIFDSKDLLVIMTLLDRSKANKYYLTNVNKLFIKEFLNKLDMDIKDIIYLEDKKNINLNNSIYLNKKDLKDVINILLILENNK